MRGNEARIGIGVQFAAADAEYAAVLQVEKELATAAVVHDKVSAYA